MVATIVAVIKSKGILGTHWEFDFTIENSENKVMEGTVSLDEAVGFAKRSDLGPVAEMCRAIKATSPFKFAGLVGRIFQTHD